MSKFLRQSWLIFIIKGFRTIVFIFIVEITIKMKKIVWKPLMINISYFLHTVKGSNFSIRHIDRTLSGNTTLGQSGPRSDGNKKVLRVLQSSSITGTSASDCLMLYPGYSMGGVLPLCRDSVDIFYSHSQLSYWVLCEY